jgi:hypothetical protein
LLNSATSKTPKTETRRERRDRRLAPFFSENIKLNPNAKTTDPKAAASGTCNKVKANTNEQWCYDCYYESKSYCKDCQSLFQAYVEADICGQFVSVTPSSGGADE